MLGFSLSKILFTAVMIIAVWWVYRQINRLTGNDPHAKPRVKKTQGKAEQPPPPPSAGVEDLAPCSACGAYVAAGTNPGCGRSAKDCPMQA